MKALLASVVLLAGTAVSAQVITYQRESPRHFTFELKAGPYRPLIDDEDALTSSPFHATFGGKAMLLVELEQDWIVWQKFGTLSAGFSVGYSEKYGAAAIDDPSGERTPSAEGTALKVMPLRALAVYRLDAAAFRWKVPLVPYAKLGLVYVPWWITKGPGIERFDGRKAIGGKWGFSATAGISLLLDVLEPRLARDFDADVGVNHSYFFAEYTLSEVNDFGRGGLNLSSRGWMFGLALDY